MIVLRQPIYCAILKTISDLWYIHIWSIMTCLGTGLLLRMPNILQVNRDVKKDRILKSIHSLAEVDAPVIPIDQKIDLSFHVAITIAIGPVAVGFGVHVAYAKRFFI